MDEKVCDDSHRGSRTWTSSWEPDAAAEAGKTVVVHYTGLAHRRERSSTRRWTAASRSRSRSGAGRVIKGWDEGVAGHGGRRQAEADHPAAARLRIAQGAGSVIPPNAELIFEVQLLEHREVTRAHRTARRPLGLTRARHRNTPGRVHVQPVSLYPDLHALRSRSGTPHRPPASPYTEPARRTVSDPRRVAARVAVPRHRCSPPTPLPVPLAVASRDPRWSPCWPSIRTYAAAGRKRHRT